jgi:hypothetical protein
MNKMTAVRNNIMETIRNIILKCLKLMGDMELAKQM